VDRLDFAFIVLAFVIFLAEMCCVISLPGQLAYNAWIGRLFSDFRRIHARRLGAK
jgi:hypothetical protein